MADGGEVELEGLRRRDAVVLIAMVDRRDKRARSLPWRAYAVLRYRIRGALRRLEQRGLVEPGWTVKLTRRPRPVRARPTPEGLRVARAAAVVLELESFAGPVDAVEMP
jgi:hypothetical protein